MVYQKWKLNIEIKESPDAIREKEKEKVEIKGEKCRNRKERTSSSIERGKKEREIDERSNKRRKSGVGKEGKGDGSKRKDEAKDEYDEKM